MLRRWCIPLAALAIALAPALASGSASASVTAVTTATPSPSPSALIAAEAAHDAHASQPAATTANSGFSHVCSAVIVVGKQSCLALKRHGIHPMVASVFAGRDPGRLWLRTLPAAVGLRPDLRLRLGRGRSHNRPGRRVQRPDRRQRPGRLPLGRRPACRSQLQGCQPERRDLAAAGHGARQRRLDVGGVARPGHGVGHLPRVQHRPGRGDQRQRHRPLRGREYGR